jgi:recombination protein RecT
MSALIIQNETVRKLNAFIDGLEVEFKGVQVEQSIEFAREAHFAMQSLLANNFLLDTARNNPQSLKDAIINVAAIGITLNPASQLAYLVPRKGKICLDVSYKGLVRMATDSGSVIWVQSELVYEKDEFTFTSIGEKPIHKFNPFAKDRGLVIGAYAIAKTFENDYLVATMSIDEIYDIRNKSEAYKSGKNSPWTSFESEMIKKTVIKRASKLWPRTSKIDRLEKAIDVVNEHEGINFNEVSDLDKDFPIPENEKIIGDDYRVQYAKFRGKQLKDISIDELEDYRETLRDRVKKGAKPWEQELFAVINTYLMDFVYKEIDSE